MSRKVAKPNPAEAEPVEELMIRAAEARPARLVRLEAALGASASGLGIALSDFSGAEVTASLHDVRYMTCADGLETADGFVALAEAPPWTGQFLLALDRPLMVALIGRLLGEDPGDMNGDHSLSPIERRIALKLLNRAVAVLTEGLSTLRELSGRVTSIREKPEDDDLGARGGRCVVAVIALNCDGVSGSLRLAMPFTLFGVDLDILAVPPVSHTAAVGGNWRKEMSLMIASAKITVKAVLGEGHVRMGDALSWRPGATLDLGLDSSKPAKICCSGRTLFRGDAGRRGNRAMALQITEEVE
jgi:flagellar motor switch protein FliM